MALQRCTNCGHTDDFSPTFICPSCNERLTPIEGNVPVSIPLCTINAGYNHVWRFVAKIGELAISGLWQCDQCHRIEAGRAISIAEAMKSEEVIIESREVPK